MKNVNHIVWADLIRVIAILMVICIHCSDPFNVSPEARLNPEYNLWGSIYGAFLRPCVPFGMITIQSLPGDTRQQIVKCDRCEQREEWPACVESCPTQALQLLTERELRRVRQQRIVASSENPL